MVRVEVRVEVREMGKVMKSHWRKALLCIC